MLSNKGTAFRADLEVIDRNTILDVTCVQTSQNHKTIDKALKAAYDEKVQKYNSMKDQSDLKERYRNEFKLIPVVIGPRGQFHRKSWKDLTELLGAQNSFEANSLSPERVQLAISLLKALAFRVAVDTAHSARIWQERQKEWWGLNSPRSQVRIERPLRN